MGLSDAEREVLLGGARALGVALDEAQVAGLGAYLELMEIWRKRSNLVSASSREEVLLRHILDSLAAAPPIQGLKRPRVLDVGSGAGLPGVPLAIACPDAEITLLEPRRKRVSFLRAVARECFTWNIRITEGRSTNLTERGTEPFDAVVSRATFAPATLPDEVAPLVAPGGLLIAYATQRTEARTLQHRDFGGPEIHAYELPRHPAEFRLITWRRRG